MTSLAAQRVLQVLTAIATIVVIIGISVAVFVNPIWVTYEQDRSAVDRLTGYSSAEVHRITGSILSDLVFGPPNFDVQDASGTLVLDGRERSHMADVRSVMMRLGGIALGCAALLLAIALAWKSGRRRFWQAMSTGAWFLVAGVIVVGLGFVLFFEQAFELFHQLFFPPGSYDFNPASERLVQLFPDQFWSDTSVAVAFVVLLLAIGVALGAGRLARREAAKPVAPEGAV